MASHYSSLGFHDPRVELDRVFARAPDEVHVDGTGAEHAIYRDASGVTLHAHVEDGSIVCVTPSFSAREPSRWRVRRGPACIDASCVHCSGVDVDVYDLAEPSADAEHYLTRATLQLASGAARLPGAPLDGEIVDSAVVAFAHDLTVYVDEAAFDGAATGMRLAVPSFMPYGMFGPVDDVTARATAQFVGRVLRARTLTNTITNAAFLHVVVAGLCGPVDVVADARAHGLPEAGAIVDVTAWLVADDLA